jgi:uncharacterized domain 1
MEKMELMQKFFEHDRFAREIGIELLEVSPGKAKAKLCVEDRHLNAANVVHGGVIFSLADLVLAMASNSQGNVALGINVSVSYLKSAQGKTLFAEANEVSRGPKLATYVMEVRDEANELIAMLMGTVYRKSESVGSLAE